jgi:hypothetical protein
LDGFELQISVSGGAFGSLISYDGSERSAELTQLVAGTEYRFRIRAEREGLYSKFSYSSKVTTLEPAPVAPNAPSLVIGEVGIGTVELSWDGEADVESYELQISEAGAAFGSSTSFAATESGAQLSDLGEGVEYQFRLRAIREGLSSSWTTSETVTTLAPDPVACDAPSLVIGEVGIGTVELSWSGEADVESYELQISEAGAAFGSSTSFAATESGAQLSDLGEAVDYQFRLRANRDGLSSSWTTSETVTTLEPAPVAPNAPSLVIGEVGIGTVELSWDGEADVESYELQISEAGAAFGSSTSFAATESGAQLSDLGEAVDYQFRLRANRDGLSSPWTTSETVTTLEPAPVAPNAPSLVIGEVGIGTVELSWDGEADVESYELQISEAGAAFGSSTSFAATESGAQLSDLGEGVTYQFRLRANRDGLSSPWTTSEIVTTLEPDPLAPQNPGLYVDAVGTATVTLSWGGEEDLDGFELQISVSGGAFGSLISYDGSERSAELTQLVAGTEYRFRIRAEREGLYSKFSYSSKVTTLEPAPVAPNAPSLVIDEVGIGTVELSWEGEADVESYELQISEAGAAFGSSTSFASTESGAQFSDLGEGVTYQFRLRANREGLSSSWTTSETVTTLEPAPVAPNAPSLVVGEVGIGTVELSWSGEADVESYELQISEAGAAFGSSTSFAVNRERCAVQRLGRSG